MKHLNYNLIFNTYKDLDDKQNWIKLNNFIKSKNATIMIYMSNFFANDKLCKEEMENTYFNKLSYNFVLNESGSNVSTYWDHLTEKYVLIMTKLSNE